MAHEAEVELIDQNNEPLNDPLLGSGDTFITFDGVDSYMQFKLPTPYEQTYTIGSPKWIPNLENEGRVKLTWIDGDITVETEGGE